MAGVTWTGRTVSGGKTRDHWSDGSTTDPKTDPPKDGKK